MFDRTIPLRAELALLRPAPATERRREPRYRCSPATAGKLYLPLSGDGLTAWVCNLSLGGVGLIVPAPIEVGTDVVISLRATAQRAVHRLAAHVVHATEEADGSWRLGCQLETPLRPDVMESLL